jgi:hypothetical protein
VARWLRQFPLQPRFTPPALGGIVGIRPERGSMMAYDEIVRVMRAEFEPAPPRVTLNQHGKPTNPPRSLELMHGKTE